MFPFSSHGEGSDDVSLHDLLSQCASDLTAAARKGALNPVFGRDDEIEQVLTSLASPLKGRILVTGEARVGKTAVINGVAAAIARDDCPDVLRGSSVWGLSPRTILRAFGVRGWQEGLGMLMEKWSHKPEVILFVDALPTMMLAGATMEDPFDMAQFLLGQFQNSNSRILAEGRSHQIQSFLEAYPEYRHVLLEIRVAEPPITEAVSIVKKAVTALSRESVTVTSSAIDMAVDVTRRFALQESLPGKAIDLIEESIALRSTEAESPPTVTEGEIIERFTDKTGLPRMLLTDEEPFDEEVVRRHFNDQVLGQEQAVDIVVQALSLLRTRLNNPRRPMGVFLFIGPTGVGKTELARVLARFLFGSDDVIVRFNMADYTQEWHTRTLFGDPHGYSLESRRGQFTTRLQDHAFAVVLLDEFEKAHPEIYQHFLQLFDEGVHINGASETINLRNSIVILTSNFGAQMLEAQRIGFGPSTSLEEQERQIREEIVRFFSPEFINRIDNVCFFKPLTKPILREIAYRRVQEVLQREGITRRGLQVEIEDAVIEWVVEHGYSERYGARYLARQIEKTITYPLARQVIRNEPPEKSIVRLFLHNEQVASALSLPERNRTGEFSTAVPRRLTLQTMKAGLPLLTERVEALEADEDLETARAELSAIMRRMSMIRFWDEPENIQHELRNMSRLAHQVELIDGLRRNLDELTNQLTIASETGQLESLTEAANRYRYLVNEIARAESAMQYRNPWHRLGAYVLVKPVGRRDVAQTWAEQITEMLRAWADHAGFEVSLLGEDWRRNGVGAVLCLAGEGVYGWLHAETGRHRLITTKPDGSSTYVQAEVRVLPALPTDDLPPINSMNAHVEPAERDLPIAGQARYQAEVGGGIPPAITLWAAHTPDLDILRRLYAVTAHPEAQQTSTTIIRDYDRFTDLVTDRRDGSLHFDLPAILAGNMQPLLDHVHATEKDTP